jgi:hypothetical protein
MVDCAYCEHPLICDACRTPYKPSTQEEYESLSQLEVGLSCRECGTVLVCHWCKTPYEGLSDEKDDSDAPPQG